ncbi:hypothetical protein [Vitiosangium sp. GDMCC 1.1324]|uniref:hypothetical protein n=1 Tax=Vitiosangium sp. (strain GDMCC 1.1324) TaxID=2138576 RepID=UPI000D370B60|nr:hypothetical protein [Vitiosangium sp. GDMCC 1.1324]PTL81625.1 hypothetical protein DAT35_21990 [Vitiosangium sp. GDMCC 1.1324]
MKSVSGVSGILAALVLWSGGWLGCGGEARVEPEQLPGEPTEERDHEVSPSEEDPEDALDVSAAWNTPSHSCTGLVPSNPGAGRTVNRNRESEGCLPGTTDGRGDLALGIFSTLVDAASWTVFTPDGMPRETFSGGVSNVLMPQKSGFHLVGIGFGSRIVRFSALSRTGALLAERQLVDLRLQGGGDWHAAEDPRGGSVATWIRVGAAPGTWQVVVQRFGTSGEPRTPILTAHEGTGAFPRFIDVGADTQGRVLVLWMETTNELHGRWLRRNQTFTSEFLVLANASSPISFDVGLRESLLSPLIGGGFALKQEDAWVAEIPSKKTTVKPAPSWLAARPGTKFFIIRGGHGYALVMSTPGGDQGRLEILAPAGNSCGDVPLPDGGLRQIRVGRDGTVISKAPPTEDDVCTYRYWPRLLH